ncbi:hypothetical protein [Rhodobacter ferrooxidans]|uniref:DUF304 domain-containing protein n=1 Tax=Rhodobacter ferrooxidans TaxID=371731 RepID=C8S1K9_9RHOB|nr:hypothetical protein [Rhodobacter sp. SW2]EEW25182.1 hypothetical protein Rsw2DRAFT_1937 [Rhodobacter sp. SW2]
MPEIKRDTLFGSNIPTPLAEGETLLQSWTSDRASYWRGHAILALVGGVIAGIVLVARGDPAPWVGPVAAVLAIGARAAYLASEALVLNWRLTNRRLLGPAGRNIPLGDISKARPFFGDVQIVTHGGDKHLMKYLADAPAVITAIDAARQGRRK